MEQSKKECILVGAAKLFSKLGFKKASIDDIAREAGVAKGTVYLACESKEELFYQVLNREVRAWCAEASKVIDPRVPADKLLELMSAAGLSYIQDNPLVSDLLFGRTAEVMPTWNDRLSELRLLGTANVCEILRLGIRQGLFRKDLDVEVCASLLQDLQLSGFVFHSYGKDKEAQIERRRVAGIDLVLNGLRISPQPK